ncbi:PH domain-containing protein [Haloplasma contractile]|uniref:PH domain protein n=1 Tax=Haloplasma contractile SSD-17B TaxID=1033810 RepID=U2ED98_9MOLU|nr:PH domain-containing protein [Haloplasma contractile]ERJ12978.1 PH domain protein [Haloplasma contractile SSD-17B]
MNTDLIKLLDNEHIEHRANYTRKTILLNLFLIYTVFALYKSYGETIYSFLLMILFYVVLVKLVLDIRKIFFDRIYITNKRIIIQKGVLFKRIMIIHLSKVLYVSHKRGLLDKYFKTGKVKITTTDQMTFKFKGLKHWDHVVNLTYTYGSKDKK